MNPGSSSYSFRLEPQTVAHVSTPYRQIHTQIPHPEDVSIIKEIIKYELSSLEKELPIVWNHAEGFQIYDRWGNRWIDLSSTIFVTNAGHNNPRCQQRIRKVIEKGLLHAYCYPTSERADFLKKLIKITPDYLESACLVSTGTEASERAIKLARLHGMTFSPRKKVIIGGLGITMGKLWEP